MFRNNAIDLVKIRDKQQHVSQLSKYGTYISTGWRIVSKILQIISAFQNDTYNSQL